jgi:hypothetical protein
MKSGEGGPNRSRSAQAPVHEGARSSIASAFAVVQILSGKLRLDAELICRETARRYRLVSVGFGSPEEYAERIHCAQLEIADGLPAENALKEGMHLIRVSR